MRRLINVTAIALGLCCAYMAGRLTCGHRHAAPEIRGASITDQHAARCRTDVEGHPILELSSNGGMTWRVP